MLEQACFREAVFKQLSGWRASQVAAGKLQWQRAQQAICDKAEAERLVQEEQERVRSAAEEVERARATNQAMIDLCARRRYHSELTKRLGHLSNLQEETEQNGLTEGIIRELLWDFLPMDWRSSLVMAG